MASGLEIDQAEQSLPIEQRHILLTPEVSPQGKMARLSFFAEPSRWSVAVNRAGMSLGAFSARRASEPH